MENFFIIFTFVLEMYVCFPGLFVGFLATKRT